MDYDIFISYRREGGAQYARILKAELEKRGYRGRVFLDYDELRDGKFDSRIMAAIDSARVFIFILSPGSLDRCCNADDWVRQEILYALEHEKHIIPVNFDGLFTGFPLAVPEEIRTALGQHQFSKIDSESLLDVSLDKMIRERIVPVVSMYDSDATQDVGAEITVIADADCAIFFFDKKLGTAQAGVPCKLKLKKGNYLLDFVSAQVPYISRKLKYAVPDNDYCDFIELTIKDEVDPELVELTPFENEEGKYGFKDSAGRVVIPCIYEYACDFHDGLAEVEKEDGPDGMKFTAWGYVDKRGREVIPCKFEYTRQFGDGLAWVEEFDGTAYYIDRTGKKVFDCTGYAMEEVRGHADGSVHIMISCMEEWTTFRVRNTLFHTVDFSKIWESGYSTKGAGRGIGLASYKKILRDYDHVFFAAAVEDGDFIQELRILGRNADISGGK